MIPHLIFVVVVQQYLLYLLVLCLYDTNLSLFALVMNSDIPPPPPPPEYSQSHEDLPEYTSSLNYYGLSLIKTEFITPYQYNSGNRSWKPVLLELNSTQLKIYNLSIDKKLQDLLICLYFELNCLDQLTKDINSHYKRVKVLTLVNYRLMMPTMSAICFPVMHMVVLIAPSYL